MTKLSLIVPFYNEKEQIQETYKVLSGYLRGKFGEEYELIFVNDGSTDSSNLDLERKTKEDSQARLISYSKNKGVGHAIKTGFLEANSPLVGYIDADLEIGTKYLDKCINYIDGFDFIITSKHLPQSKVETTWIRKFGSKTYNSWVRLILGTNITDHQSGLKIFKREALMSVINQTTSPRWIFSSELLFRLIKKGYKVKEIPISVSYGDRFPRPSFFFDYLKVFLYVPFLRLRLSRIFK